MFITKRGKLCFMQGIKVEGLVLKRRNLGEADRILTVFTYQRGKISVLAKGVRKITSRRAGNVEILNRSILFLHQGKNFWILTEADTLNTFQKIKDDLTLSTYAYHILELVDKLTAENQENRILYEDLIFALQKLSRNPRQLFVRAFEVKILSLMGFANFQEGLGLHLEEIDKEVTDLLKDLEVLNWDEIEKIKVEEKQALELERVLRYYLERVIEGKLKSRQMLRKM